jgi:2-polyprenyl-3-methyl-5-hydroxy-6-metoxy-1,4-benzoquinol methylase
MLKGQAMPTSPSRSIQLHGQTARMTQAIRRMVRRVLRRSEARPAAMPPALLTNLEELAARDRWFYDHFVWAPKIVADFFSRVMALGPAVVLDFGCGEGLMAKGLSRLPREVHGVDLVWALEDEEKRFQKPIGVTEPFPAVKLQRVNSGKAIVPRRSVRRHRLRSVGN